MGYKPVSEEELQSLAVQAPSQINRIVIGGENIASLSEFYRRGFGMTLAKETSGKTVLTDGATDLAVGRVRLVVGRRLSLPRLPPCR